MHIQCRMYKDDSLYGGHIIMLGPGNVEAATLALEAFPGGMQVGGGVNPSNAKVITAIIYFKLSQLCLKSTYLIVYKYYIT